MNENTGSKLSLGIRGRIFLGFITIAIILLITTVFVNYKIKSTELFTNKIAYTAFPITDAFLDLNGYLYASQAAALSYSITRDEKYKSEFNREWNNIDKSIAIINATSDEWGSTKTHNNWQQAQPLLKDIHETGLKIISASEVTAPSSSITTLTNQLQEKLNAAIDILDGPIHADGARNEGIYHQFYDKWSKIATEADSDLVQITIIQYILLIFYLFAAFTIAIITTRSILKPLHNAIGIAKHIANGERTLKITTTSNDETGELLSSLRIMLDAIKKNETKLQENEAKTRTLFNNIVSTAKLFSEHSSRISSGDLTKRITTDSTNEMHELGMDLNTMTDNLSLITSKITEASHNMMTTIEEVKQSVDVQSAGASEQAASINEITASLEEIEKSSTQTIEKAKALGEAAERTRDKGQLGLEAVEQSIHGMKSIREKVQIIAQTILDLSNQTQQVGEITNVVKAIAQQSKMLALNASIEAAKAGEAGKGFAVVAAEVKNLAEQSEHSTAQVQKILEDIRHATEKAVMATEEGTKGVDQGTELVEQTGEVLRNLSAVIHETTIASEQIAAAIRQEGVGIEQITAGMNEINQVTASFVASAKQTTEAIDNLSAIAKSLKENVDIYKI
jgi:methyl-accepting chemotaxis protein